MSVNEPAASVINRSESGIANEQLPELFNAADKSAGASQKNYFRLLRWELILLFSATALWAILAPWETALANLAALKICDISVFGLTIPTSKLSGDIAAGVIPGLLMAGVLVLMIVRLVGRPDERWRRYRALAEGVAGIAWRYAMHAQPGELPFAAPGSPTGVEAFVAAYEQLYDEAAGLELPMTGKVADQITARMTEICDEKDLEVLRDTYVDGRVVDQLTFYSTRAGTFLRRRRALRAWILVFVAIAVLTVPFHGLNIFTTAATALGTWLGARQYDDLGPSYTKLERDLTLRATQGRKLALDGPEGRDHLARYVHDVETLFEGEHRLWLTRSTH
ncbi:MAG TPA: DUF4231 domain-containing protein [Ktedonobacterales bacterium]|nr:DUF4231 domain-containing protein [Ktedonobacterales bacterium]